MILIFQLPVSIQYFSNLWDKHHVRIPTSEKTISPTPKRADKPSCLLENNQFSVLSHFVTYSSKCHSLLHTSFKLVIGKILKPDSASQNQMNFLRPSLHLVCLSQLPRATNKLTSTELVRSAWSQPALCPACISMLHHQALVRDTGLWERTHAKNTPANSKQKAFLCQGQKSKENNWSLSRGKGAADKPYPKHYWDKKKNIKAY